MLRASRPIIFAACVALAGCGVADTPPGPTADGVDMRGGSVGGAFTLTDQAGEQVSWSDFDGKYRMVYFGFTSCPAICPTDVLKMSQGLERFENALFDGHVSGNPSAPYQENRGAMQGQRTSLLAHCVRSCKNVSFTVRPPSTYRAGVDRFGSSMKRWSSVG